MNRRVFLSVTATIGLLGFSGCISRTNVGGNTSDSPTKTDDPSTKVPDIDGEEPELTPGTDTTLTVKAGNVTNMHFSTIPDPAIIELDLSGDNVSPSPDATAESYPPQWGWSSQTSVTVEVPITIADDAEPGQYPYEVTVNTDTGRSTSTTKEPHAPVSVTADAGSGDTDNSTPMTEKFTISIVEN